MKLTLRLAWHKPGAPTARAFKLPGAYEAFSDYTKRLGKNTAFAVEGGFPEPGGRLWLLDRGPGAKVLSSEDVASFLEREKSLGGRFEVLVGPADGFTPADLAALKPSLRWSFGPLTLPHELAAVVAAEQLYRAFTILAKTPYHLAH